METVNVLVFESDGTPIAEKCRAWSSENVEKAQTYFKSFLPKHLTDEDKENALNDGSWLFDGGGYMDILWLPVDNDCPYCGGDCRNDEENACDGYLGDVDGLLKSN